MSIVDFIEPSIPVLMPKDTVEDALRMMSETHYAKLPLVDNGIYVSLLSETDLLDCEDPNTVLSAVHTEVFRPSCIASAHPFDAVKAAIQFNLPVVPILTEQQMFLGCVSRVCLFTFLGEYGSLAMPGGILVLEVKPGDYILSQIAKIAEDENVQILNSRVFQNPQSGMLEVTLKMNKVELQRVVASLERYDYVVKEIFGDFQSQDDMDDRYKLLMNYLNI